VTDPEPQHGKSPSMSQRESDQRAPDQRGGQRLAATAGQVRMARLTILGAVGFPVLGVAWFVVSWAVLDSPVVDAVGESVGGVMLVLLMLSIFGSLLRSR
jgi:hypothetical protein